MFTFPLSRHLPEKEPMKPSSDTHVASEQELRQLYRKLPDIKRYLSVLGCGKDEAEDLFQEALVIYIRKKEQPGFELNVEPFFYVRNTCKLLWYNRARKQGRNPSFSLETDVAAQDDEWFEKEQRLRSIELALAKLGEQCRELLQLFYGLEWNMSDIAQKIGLRNDKVAKAQKYRCLQKAKELAHTSETIVESEIQEP